MKTLLAPLITLALPSVVLAANTSEKSSRWPTIKVESIQETSSALNSTLTALIAVITLAVLILNLWLSKESTAVQERDESDSSEAKAINPNSDSNLTEAIRVYEKTKRRSTYLWLTTLLTDSTYSIGGGIAATSFIQAELPKTLLGVVGVVVAFASLVNKHFQPGEKLYLANKRNLELERTIRSAKRSILVLDRKDPDISAVVNIRERIDNAILAHRESEVENSKRKKRKN